MTPYVKLDCHHGLYVIELVIASPILHLREIVDKVQKIIGVWLIFCRLLAQRALMKKKLRHVALQRTMKILHGQCLQLSN